MCSELSFDQRVDETMHSFNCDIARQFGWRLRRNTDTDEMAEIVESLLYRRNDISDVLELAKSKATNSATNGLHEEVSAEEHKVNVEIARRFGWKLKRCYDAEKMADIVAALLYNRYDATEVLETCEVIFAGLLKH